MLRDTDEDWRNVAETDPYFGVIGDPRYHRGRVNENLLDELYRGGEAEIQSVIDAIRIHVPRLVIGSALDFGCGVGRHTLALARYAKHVVGFDIAPGMTALALEAAGKRAIANCTFVNHLPDEERFDWINSYQVFQHIPPERGYNISADLFDRLAFGGICSLQFTLFRDNRHLPSLAGSLWTFDGERANALSLRSREGVGQITLFDYQLNRLLAQMLSYQIELLGITMTERGGHYGAWIFGRKHLRGLLIEPGLLYEAQNSPNFEPFLGEGWSDLEVWGVWSSGGIATLTMRIDPALRHSHVLKLYGKAFVNPQNPRVVVEVAINSSPAIRQIFTEANEDEVLALRLHDVAEDGTAAIRLLIDSPKSPVACGLPTDDTRNLGFGLEAITLELIAEPDE